MKHLARVGTIGNLKDVKNTHGGVILLINLQTVCNLYNNKGTKFRRASQIIYRRYKHSIAEATNKKSEEGKNSTTTV